MIKNIIFDLSEVIISGYHKAEEIVGQNTKISSEEFLKRRKEINDIYLEVMRGKYSEEEYLSRLLKGTNWDISTEKLKELIRQNLNIPIKGTMDIIRKLKGKYHLILLSDHVKEWVEYILENNTEIQIFEHQYFSYKYGKLKEDEDCFEYIIEDLQINPSETIFIDDAKENINMAKKSGIEGILFENAQQLEEELMERGIL